MSLKRDIIHKNENMKEEKNYDAVIIGGSYAGLSAALTLGRALRNVLVVDSGRPCNRQAPHSHNFLTQDGSTPAEISALGKDQVMKYPTITYLNDEVTAVKGEDNNFVIVLSETGEVKAKKILFSTGVKDLMPALKGFTECWGISVIPCPYCHGYEYKNLPTGILANGNDAFDFARLINNWTGDLTIFTDGKCTISDINRQQLSNKKIVIIEKELLEIEHTGGQLDRLIFTDGTAHKLDVLYTRVPFEQHCKIPEQMGCKLNEMGHLVIDQSQKSSVAGVYAAGDNTIKMRSVSSAVASGNFAGAVINHELIIENF